MKVVVRYWKNWWEHCFLICLIKFCGFLLRSVIVQPHLSRFTTILTQTLTSKKKLNWRQVKSNRQHVQPNMNKENSTHKNRREQNREHVRGRTFHVQGRLRFNFKIILFQRIMLVELRRELKTVAPRLTGTKDSPNLTLRVNFGAILLIQMQYLNFKKD